MAISKEKFLRIFLDEFQENLLSAETQVVLLKGDSENTDALSTLLRTLHTIKGSSRLLQFENIERLVHGTETVFKGVRDGRYAIDNTLVHFFFIIADHLRFASDSIRNGGDDSIPEMELLLSACEKLSANEPFDLFSIRSLNQAGMTADGTGANGEKPYPAKEGTVISPPDAAPEETRPDGEAHDGGARVDAASIRVDSLTIDKSINLVNTLTIRQMRLRGAVDQMDALEKKITHSYRNNGDIKALRKELTQMSRTIRHFKSQYEEQR
jgi:chemotaxis protein histidine kinase CheA